jgi:hypothetical protein
VRQPIFFYLRIKHLTLNAMNKVLREKLFAVLSIPVALFIALVPFSLLIGWNLVTFILFWLIVIPIVALHVPTFFKKNANVFQTLIGVGLFYAVMVFMIYDHYKTDYFQMMLVSLVVNSLSIVVVNYKRNKRSGLTTNHAG